MKQVDHEYPDGSWGSMTVCWVGWLPLAWFAGAVFGAMVGLVIGVFAT